MRAELWHYGIAGQKWGIRRFQNEDGSLTPEGLRRYGSLENFQKQNGIRGESFKHPDAKADIDKAAKLLYNTSKQRNEYLRTLNYKQRQAYNSLNFGDQKRLWKKLSKGKDFDKALKEMNRESALLGLGVMAAILYASPVTRGFMKSAGKAAVRTIKNSNVAQKGAMWIKKMAQRRSMVKNGAVVLKKSAYSVRDIPFGGYLTR